MHPEDPATAAPGSAPRWVHAYQQASTELAPVIDGIVVTAALFAPTGDLVVFFNPPNGSRYAWIYDRQHLPSSGAEEVEFARLSLLGDLVPPARWTHPLDRADLAPWAAQFGDARWGGRTNQP
ncbi:hypothetical protein [Kocuria oceani]|uniref:Uncharacterized protein n=1 Tax=Kocuria oceani TaxID=988827 RepID=A0ABV9TPD4_9MICC|nr:hypothetical protein [Kocuria oceani]